MRFFVTGATGFIGSHFCNSALAAGHKVTALCRPASASRLPVGVEAVYGSLPYDLPVDSLRGCEAVIHLAAVTTSSASTEAEAVNLLGTRMLLEAASNARCGFVFVSTQSTLSSNQSAYARTKREGEEFIRESQLATAIVRPGLVYGPGDAGLFGRMRNVLKKAPAVPLLGGGKALVQPIHVDDLASALLKISADLKAGECQEFNLGQTDPITMKQLLQKIAEAEGISRPLLTVPLAPVSAVVAVGESLRLPLPIGRDNLQGFKTVIKMDTAPSLAKLGMQLRPLEEGLQKDAPAAIKTRDNRVGCLLIGAGKIGIVHGLQLLNNPKAHLVGIVEPNPKASGLFKSMGFPGPYFDTLVEAVEGTQPAAAVIATPAFTHLDVAKQCLEVGLNVLVEKPVSISTEQTSAWLDLRKTYPDRVIHTGYMACQFPHILTAYHAARMEKLGHIYKARVVALQTHITAPEPVRWEMLKSKSGGGAMINFGCHAASILFRLLGWPDTPATGWQWPIYSTEVEDALAAQFKIRSVQCNMMVSWSVPGYARPYSLVELECEHGMIRVENTATTITKNGRTEIFENQLDRAVGFNLSPDYTGSGFAMEHENFFQAVKARDEQSTGSQPLSFMPPVELAEALRLESWIYNLYSALANKKPGYDDLLNGGFDPKIASALLRAGGRQ